MEFPIIVEDFLNYMETIRGKSPNTVKAYQYDLILLFRFMKQRFKLVPGNVDFEEINIADIDETFIQKIKLNDLYAFISFAAKTRNNAQYARARKVACLRSFFKYLMDKVKILDSNPAMELEPPKIYSRHPVYLQLKEAQKLINSIEGTHKERDKAIITLFLNCGLRLSELTNIKLEDIQEDTLKVVGKGNKERTVYLSNACLKAIEEYMKVRSTEGIKNKSALFLSQQKKQISERTVQHLVKKHLNNAGLDSDKVSVHKLRHTAATLMYQYGEVDIRALQQILGHENISTTQIYTHIDNEQLRRASQKNPLANFGYDSIDIE
ncbi:tyrosine recombinase XerC [Irregularibacter muris]|uniref:Tyrosine recombinase XerC n=1 Tax=Irregularibacter muris TaxID=1796619 RepID=A0AAE3KYS1_9FIRM|nr:site-specific tyrosine recombinase/integron integrase [Irregularibacter muris]MCR1898080.1 tyrosine recombinase XerC [Irregularibacter muris]